MQRAIVKFLVSIVGIVFLSACGDSNRSGAGSLVEASSNGLSGVTYICVGDSTRAESGFQGQYLFYEVSRELSKRGVRSRLLARSGHSLQQFNQGSSYPTTSDVIYSIPSEGEKTIVDISLGINDRYRSKDAIKNDIKQAVRRISSYRPQTQFVLTTPNRLYYDSEHTQRLRYAYHEAANELGIELNPVVDGLMPSRSSTPASWYHSDGIHLSREGQHQVAQFILGNML